MTDDLSKAQQLLDQAKIALQYNDRQAARRLAQQAIRAEPGNRDVWLFMAGLSKGNAKKAYLEQAERLNTTKSRGPFVTDLAGREAVSEISHISDAKVEINGLDKRRIKEEPTQPIPIQNIKRPNYFAILATIILVTTVLVSVLVWISYPTPTVSASDHSSFRMDGELLKPSLTPTITPEPTLTPTATNTPEPTPTQTPETVVTTTQSDVISPLTELPPNVADDERWIDVDLTHQVTYAYEGSTLIRTFIVSTGTQYHPTVTGQYHIYVKYRYTDMAGPGYYLPDVPYTMYFYKGYSLHGTYWHDNFGQPMSHGCVNMRTPDAEWLFYWASVGTLVNVHY